MAGKRLLAYLAWLRKRRRAVPDAALLADVAAAGADHIAITGDLTNLGLPDEFAAAREWMARLGPPGRLSVVPGNHDATLAMPFAQGVGQWRHWMAEGLPPPASAAFPFLRRRPPVALIGLSTAVPTLPGSAAGRLGAQQLASLPALLDETGREGLFRIILLHHPPAPGPGGRRKALSDGAALRATLARHGAELVLHGHHHAALRTEVPGPAGPIPVLGAPQALATGKGPAGWLLHRIIADGPTLRRETSLRLQDAATGRFPRCRLGGGRQWLTSGGVSAQADRYPRPGRREAPQLAGGQPGTYSRTGAGRGSLRPGPRSRTHHAARAGVRMPSATVTKFGYPATLIGETAHWIVLLRPEQVTLGALVLACRAPVTSFAAIGPAAFADLHDAVGRIETILRDFVGYEKINYLMLMMVDPDVHFHVIPRYGAERVHLGCGFPDAGWPGPPALGKAIVPAEPVRQDILDRLRAAWAAAAA